MLPNAEERRYLLNLPTTLSLPPEAVDRLRDAAGRLLRESPAFRELVRELDAQGAQRAEPMTVIAERKGRMLRRRCALVAEPPGRICPASCRDRKREAHRAGDRSSGDVNA